MDPKQALALIDKVRGEVKLTQRLMPFFEKLKGAGGQEDAVQFDSMLATNPAGREAAMENLPPSLANILNHQYFQKQTDQQMVFDGISDGIAEYQARNGGESPSSWVIANALVTASTALGDGSKKQLGEGYTFDSLNFSSHSATSIVPAATQVFISQTIANALPIVTMLPNPTGANELPIVHTQMVAGRDLAAARRGELLDGSGAGLPYFENRHVLTMTKDATTPAKFTLSVHTKYDKATSAHNTLKFVPDTNSSKAPFIAGRVFIKLKGRTIAQSPSGYSSSSNVSGVLSLQVNSKPLVIGGKKYQALSAIANLDTQEIEITFSEAAGFDVPVQDDVVGDVSFDYERKDGSGKKILTEPSTDIQPEYETLRAYPSRTLSTASIDAITQLANELGLDFFSASQYISLARYILEQNARLLRAAYEMAITNADAKEGRVLIYDFNTNGVAPTNIASASTKINQVITKGRTRLSRAIGMVIGTIDIYVSDRGAVFFAGMDGSDYESTSNSYGDNGSVYMIGRLKKSNANVYYIPPSLGVLDETVGSPTTARALCIARPLSQMKAQFVGFNVVPPLSVSSNADAFEQNAGSYMRQAADINPIGRYQDQSFVIEMINLPI
ncbi:MULTISPECIES: hypothetical protein [unclassified Psychrobacter]|uniref:hypothetical protein n=1 Tax=unclassified Psychrobacter TaxID=196806 RepID=UPI0018F58C44|nr:MULTISPECIES: hypothetical protein [unclassified Psychrobacter]